MKRGLSNLVAFIFVIMMTLMVASSFYYWVSDTQSEAMGTTEAFTEDLQTQVISRASSWIDLYYKTDKEKNINNFGEVRQIICAEDRKINTAESEISLELYEGYGSNLKLICAVNDFDGSVINSTDYIFGVLGGKDSTQIGITGIKCSSTECDESSDWTSMSISSEFASHNKFSFYVLDSFVEGGDYNSEPKNLLLMGQGYNGSQYDPIILILDSNFQGKSYDLFTGGNLGGSSIEYPGAIRDFYQNQAFKYVIETETFTRVGGQQIAGFCEELNNELYTICSFDSSYCCDDSYGHLYEGIVVTREKVYDSPAGGTHVISSMNITEVTTITEIIRNSIDKFLIGGFISEGDGGGITNIIGKLYELDASGAPVYTPYTSCPYDSAKFLSVLGISIDIASCISDDSYELFDKAVNIVKHGDNVLIGVNGLNYSSGAPAGACSGFGKYDDGSYCWIAGEIGEDCDQTCRDRVGSNCIGTGGGPQTWNDTALCSVLGNLSFNCGICIIPPGPAWFPAAATPGGYAFGSDASILGPVDCQVRSGVDTRCTERDGISSRACACDRNDFVASTSKIPWFLYTPYIATSTTISPVELGGISASTLANYNLTDILSDGSQVYLLLVNSSETAVYNLTVDLSTAVISAVNSDSIGSIQGKSLGMHNGVLYVGAHKGGTGALVFRYKNDVFNTTEAFLNSNYDYVEKLTDFTDITHKKPYCSSGCDKVLSRGECSELVFKLENTDCDISSYSQGTSFTMRLNIGRYFQDLQIFTKKGFDSDEVNATIT